jgi:hypothetical protein
MTAALIPAGRFGKIDEAADVAVLARVTAESPYGRLTQMAVS